MDMATIMTTTCRLSPTAHRRPIASVPCSHSFKPISSHYPKAANSSAFSRPSIYHGIKTTIRKPLLVVSAVSRLENGNSETEPDEFNKEAKIDINLPRRSLQVQFTCNLCGERTQRLVNRHAYERGLIYVQCAGCLKHHKLVDNLGLVVEYDLRNEVNSDKEDRI